MVTNATIFPPNQNVPYCRICRAVAVSPDPLLGATLSKLVTQNHCAAANFVADTTQEYRLSTTSIYQEEIRWLI